MLQKCPICGGEPLTRKLLCYPPKYQVFCSTPNCERTVTGCTEQEAEDLWNEKQKPCEKIDTVPADRATILAIIDDAMQNRDRYVQLFFGHEGVAVTVYPWTEGKEE